MKIGLVGWGIETQSAYRYFGYEHFYTIVSEEKRDDFPDQPNVTVYSLSETRKPGLVGNVADLSYLDHVIDCDLVIYQPSAHKNLEHHFDSDHSFWLKAKTVQHIFFENTPTKNIIGVTGTKGKGTTSTLISTLLEAGGYDVRLGGNIGIATLDLLGTLKETDWVVLELSSFQLYRFPYSPHIAVHLMMMPEHIAEWHKTMDDYVEAKRNIFAHQTKDDVAIYLPSNKYSSDNVRYSPGRHVPYFKAPGAFINDRNYIEIDNTEILNVQDVGLLGSHNLQNICAALTAVWTVHHDLNAYRDVLSSFKGLEHRLQLAGEINGVRFYDDSFGTTPDTAIVAMDAFSEPKVMIVGGHDKGNPFSALAKRLTQSDVKHVVFIGTTGQTIYHLALQAGFDPLKATIRDDGNSWTMNEIVESAKAVSTRGDVVLLSTGCASFGLFKDYKDRGNQFIKTVVKFA